jgi:predicted transcriptional regulator/DNA-binding XRE family transcriptional regulator
MTRIPIGQKIRELRKALGRTQAALAAEIGISTSYLNLIEANKRQVGGRLLQRIAAALEVELDQLDGAAEHRLAELLREVAAEPLLRDQELAGESVVDLVGRYPDWARALITLYRAYQDQTQIVNALSDRLNHDPFLGEAVHGMLNHVTAIRSSAEILESVDDLEAGQRLRFDRIIHAESGRLAEVATRLAGYFDKAATRTRSITPSEEIDDLLWERDNHFPTLEAAAENLLRRRFAGEVPDEAALAADLCRRHGIELETVGQDELGEGARNDSGYDRDARRLRFTDAADGSTRRFQAARLLVALELEPAIAAEIEASAELTTPEARRLALGALSSYAAGAMLMPYDRFLEDAERLRYDVQLLAHRHGSSFEQACHRLVTLRREGAAGIAFGFMRSDPAGFVTKRFPLPHLPIPRHGHACPLWAVYGAFQTPGVIVRQLAELPSGDRFLFVARAITKERAVFQRHRHMVSIMLACEARAAERTTYAEGLDFTAPSLALPVGPTCRLCPRPACRHREEEPIIGA